MPDLQQQLLLVQNVLHLVPADSAGSLALAAESHGKDGWGCNMLSTVRKIAAGVIRRLTMRRASFRCHVINLR